MSVMSGGLPSISTTTDTSTFNAIFNNALNEYENKTGTNLTTHPLADKLQTCDSPDAVLNVLQEHERAYEESRNGDRRLTKLLDPTIHILYLFSVALGEGVGLAFGPAKVIFAGFSVLLAVCIIPILDPVPLIQISQTAKASKAGHNALVDLFERVGSFLKRLKIYSGIPLTAEINEVFGKIIVEILSILALSTKEMERGRTRRFLHRLLGGTDIEDALRRLDKLTQEEARMIMAQVLKFTHDLMSATNEQNRDQLREKHRGWLSPPNPSVNHNVACNAHQGGTTAWLLPNDSFKEWQKGGSLLWIHGKPGSGKSVVCSTIIEDIDRMRDEKPALMAYYYFDFRDTAKQDARGLLCSLLIQLSYKSNRLCDTLSHLYSKHDHGSRQPSDRALVGCLKDMLKQLGQAPLYIILDALDECPHGVGTPSARESVLQLVGELVDLRYPNVYICVTSRPESDILATLDPLAPHRISIHEEDGQKEDIASYISSFVHSDIAMQRWMAEDKELVISTLSTKTDGMFRWVYCQLDALRRCLPANIQHALNRLPETLDGTYERTLSDIPEEKWEHAHRLFQCLIASNRPLRVEELAEVLAIEFGTAGTANLETGWRAEEAVLSTCSTLIMVVDNADYNYDYGNYNGSRIVQFSHFSVQEFLTSSRLSGSRPNISRYHVLLGPAHTILAQACLSALLRLDDSTDEENILNFPLAVYAANHWHVHTLEENMNARIQDDIWCLFDLGKPHYAAWTWINSKSYGASRQRMGIHVRPSQLAAPPLFYAARFGLRDLVVDLVATRPQDINATHIREGPPLLSAVLSGHMEIAKLLIEHGAHASIGNADCSTRRTPLGEISAKGYLELVKLLLKHDSPELRTDMMAQDQGWEPSNHKDMLEIIRLLLHRGADTRAKDKYGTTPLHNAASSGEGTEVVKLLIGHGADVNAKTDDLRTPLHLASESGSLEIVRLLVGHGADISAVTRERETILHMASGSRNLEVVRFFVECGADVDAKSEDLSTPLYTALSNQNNELAHFLVERGADVNAKKKHLWTPLHMASIFNNHEAVRFLVERGADISAATEMRETPLHWASRLGTLEHVRFLVECGANIGAETRERMTPLHFASEQGKVEIMQFLFDYGVDVNAKAEDLQTPLHLASRRGNLGAVELLVEHGAAISARTKARETPLHMAAKFADIRTVRFLVGRGADVNSRTDDLRTPLHLVSECPDYGTVAMLEYGQELIRAKRKVIHFLITHGANVSARDSQSQTPSGLALASGHYETAQFLLEHWHLAVTKGDSSDSIPESHSLLGGFTPHPSMRYSSPITGSPETTD
ncbi:ankyrin repeat-containing domain protein [Lactarius hengduanensis]|nr:ankyrin repeat-containing domain protein [Lactarius hengduanensis]